MSTVLRNETIIPTFVEMDERVTLAAQMEEKLGRGIGGRRVFLNYGIWESSEHFKRAFSRPAFRSRLVHYPASTRVSSHLFQNLAMPGIRVS
jgi:hypothetical protein